jgi:hypothetical protein
MCVVVGCVCGMETMNESGLGGEGLQNGEGRRTEKGVLR